MRIARTRRAGWFRLIRAVILFRPVFALRGTAAVLFLITLPPPPGSPLFMTSATAASMDASSAALADAPDVSNEPWPELSDGRLVLKIFRHRLAIAPCERNLRSVEFHVSPQVSGLPSMLTFQNIVREPRLLRTAVAGAREIMLIAPNVLQANKLWLCRFDSGAVPATAGLAMIIYREPVAGCPPGFLRLFCDTLINLANKPSVHTETNYGFFELTGPQPGILDHGKLYVVPASRILSANGMPMFFLCDEVLRSCGNSDSVNYGPGFFILKDVGVTFTFNPLWYPRSDWIELHQRMDSMFRSILVDDENGGER